MTPYLPPESRIFTGSGLGLLLVACILGCSGRTGPERAIVSGSVTYDGQPVDDGMIRFVPAEGTKAPVSGAVIKAGRYTVDSHGGVPVGTRRVEILGNRPDPKAAPAQEVPGLEGVPSLQYLPAKYNQTSQLTLTVKPGGGRVTQDFALEK